MTDVMTLTLDTGEVKIETMPDKAPKHVEQIKRLAEDGFYDGLTLHRVIEGFMAQMGCPRGDGTGGSGKNVKAEFNDVSHQRGVVSMARAQSPDSADSQFFIVFDDASFLDGQYTAWGKVISGMEAVDAAQRGEPPASPTKIVSFRTDS
ncbi:MAG: peptidylprolyl isomerase [Pseudomonadota bacterium]